MMNKNYMIFFAIFLGLSFNASAQTWDCSPDPNHPTCSATLGNGIFTISGSGPMKDYSSRSDKLPPWFSSRNSISSIVVGKDISSIGRFSFYNSSVETFEIQKDSQGNSALKTIGMDSFWKASNLHNLDLSGVQEIGGRAFGETTGLTTLDLSGVQKIGTSAFIQATNLINVNLSDVQEIGQSAFSYTGLTSVDLTNVQTIASSAFSNISNLKDVTLAGIETIPPYAFSNTGIESLDLTGVKKIEANAFYGTTALTALDLTGVEEIDDLAFYGAARLKSVILSDSLFSESETMGISPFAFMGSGVEKIYCPKGQNCSAYFKTCDSNAYNSYYEDGICWSDDIDDETDPIPVSAEIVSYSIENGKIKLENGKTYASFDDLQKGNYIKKRIYTVEEASRLSKPTGNTFKLRYK